MCSVKKTLRFFKDIAHKALVMAGPEDCGCQKW